MGSSSPLCLPSLFTSSPSPSLPHALMMAHSHSHHRIPLAPSSLSATSSTADDHDILDDVFADQPNEPHPLHDSNGLSHSHSHSHSHSSGNEEDPNSLDDVFDLSPLPEDEDDANLIHHRHHSHTNGVDILETFGDHYEHDQETHHEHEHEHSSVSSHSSASSSSSHSSSSPHSHVHDDHLSHGDGFTLENNIFDHELEIHTSPVYSSSSSSSSSSSASSSASSSIYSPSYSAPSSPLHGNGLHHASEDLPPSFGITLPSPSKTETYVTKNRMENCALIPDYLEDDSERQKLLQSYDDFHKEEVTLWDPATAKKKEQPDTTHDASLLLCFKLLQRLFGRTVSFEKVLYLYSANGYNFESAIRSCFPNLRLLDSEKTSLPCPRDILFNIRDWSELEKDLFETGLENFGKNWRLMHRLIKSRTRAEMLPYYYYWKGTSRFERFMEVRRQAEMDNNSARSHNWRFLVKLKRGLFGLPPISKCRVIAEPFSLPAPADNLVTEEEILLPRRVILGDGHDFDPSTDLDHRLPSSSTSSHPPRSRRPPPPSPPSSSAVVVSSEEVEPSRQFEVDSSMNVMEGEQEPLFDLQGADVRPSGRESSYLFDPQQSPLLADEDEAAEEFDVVEDDGDSSFEDPLRPRSFLHHDRPSSASSQPPRKRHRDA